MKKKVEKIKLFNLDKSKITKRHTSKNSSINTTCSCLNCLNFNQMKWQNELNIEVYQYDDFFYLFKFL